MNCDDKEKIEWFLEFAADIVDQAINLPLNNKRMKINTDNDSEPMDPSRFPEITVEKVWRDQYFHYLQEYLAWVKNARWFNQIPFNPFKSVDDAMEDWKRYVVNQFEESCEVSMLSLASHFVFAYNSGMIE